MNKEQFYRGRRIKLETDCTPQGWACKFSITDFATPSMARSGEYAKDLYATEEQAQLAAFRAAQESIVSEIYGTSA